MTLLGGPALLMEATNDRRLRFHLRELSGCICDSIAHATSGAPGTTQVHLRLETIWWGDPEPRPPNKKQKNGAFLTDAAHSLNLTGI